MRQKADSPRRAVRHAAEWPVEKAAHFAGVSVRTLYRYEAGDLVIESARRGLDAAYAQMTIEVADRKSAPDPTPNTEENAIA